MEIEGVKIDFLGHSGIRVGCLEGKKIIIDPYNLSQNASMDKADMILITHGHYDHCSIKDMEKVVKEKTIIVCPADVQSKIMRLENVEMQIIEAGDELEFGKIKIEAFPAYNIGKSLSK